MISPDARRWLLLSALVVAAVALVPWNWGEAGTEEPALLHATVLAVPDEEARMGDAGASMIQATRHLDELERDKSYDALYRARRALALLSSFTGDPPRAHPREHRARRAELLHLWLRMFRLIDAALDPSFDPKDVAQNNVWPPVDHPVYQMSDIEDPALRAAYEQAVAENDRKGQRWMFQTMLRRYDAEFEPDLGWFMRAWWSPTPEDQEALAAAIRADLVNPARVARLLQMVPR